VTHQPELFNGFTLFLAIE